MDEVSRVAPTAKPPELILEPDADGVAIAAAALRRGHLVAFPTETVYGLGADACNGGAVVKIYAVKQRPALNPLIVHVKNLEMAELYGHFNAVARRLASLFWPGPLTLVVKRRKDHQLARLEPISDNVSPGLDTIALRIPSNEVAQKLLHAFDGPIAAPSANLSGRLSPTEAEHVEDMLGAHVAHIIDGGACEQGIESTIIGFEGDGPVLLRPGILPVEQIETVSGIKLEKLRSDGDVATGSPKLTAPGQLGSHYAPNARLRLEAKNAGEGELMLAFGPDAPKDRPGVNLSPAGDLVEAAANLYAYLHLLDDTGIATIAVMPIPDKGLGVAINDRLRRAAAPRPDQEG